VSVFDFASILATTQTRLEHDLLGSGPQSVAELKQLHTRLRLKYKTQLQSRLQQISAQFALPTKDTKDATVTMPKSPAVIHFTVKTGSVAGEVWHKLSTTASTVATKARVGIPASATTSSSPTPNGSDDGKINRPSTPSIHDANQKIVFMEVETQDDSML
jgi:hypothetical protein